MGPTDRTVQRTRPAASCAASVLVTGANRGIGKALVAEALARGAERVYAGTRQAYAHADARVVPLTLDVTDAAQIRAAADAVPSLDLLINNAGLALWDDDLSDRALLERHFAVNFFGVFDVTRAFLPALMGSRGRVLNILSTASWVNLPLLPGYSVSKAAAFSLTQGLRGQLARSGVGVHAAMVGIVDTDMTASRDVPKSSPVSVATRIFDGLERGEDEIFPDDAAARIGEAWRESAFKALETRLASEVQAAPKPAPPSSPAWTSTAHTAPAHPDAERG